MKLCKGAHRFVVIIGPLAFKIPRVALIKQLKYLIKLDFFWFKWRFIKKDLFDGFKENFREARCWFKTKHKFLVPVYVPFLIVNVCPRVRGVGKLDIDIFYLTIVEIDRRGEDDELIKALDRCMHTFREKMNFASDGNRAVFLDYGERGVEEVITKHGDKVERLFLSTID